MRLSAPGAGRVAGPAAVGVAVRLAACVAMAVSAAWLGGCASVPSSTAAGGDSLSGRLTVRVEPAAGSEGKVLSAAFALRGDAREGALDLNTPLGTTLARARWAPGGVALTTPDGEQRFADLDGLSRQSLGEAVPLAALFDWLRGRPWGGAASTASAPPSAGFTQLGWTVDLARFDEGWIAATRTREPAVNLRAKLDR